MREFRAQATFAAPLVTGTKIVRGDVQQGIPPLLMYLEGAQETVRSASYGALVAQSVDCATLPVYLHGRDATGLGLWAAGLIS